MCDVPVFLNHGECLWISFFSFLSRAFLTFVPQLLAEQVRNGACREQSKSCLTFVRSMPFGTYSSYAKSRLLQQHVGIFYMILYVYLKLVYLGFVRPARPCTYAFWALSTLQIYQCTCAAHPTRFRFARFRLAKKLIPIALSLSPQWIWWTVKEQIPTSDFQYLWQVMYYSLQ